MRFEDLEVWKKSARLASELYKATSNLKDWGFRDQVTRAALSISSNIAEGFERTSELDCIRFLDYAKGSSGEVRSQLYIGMDIGYIDKAAGKQWVDELKTISGMVAGLMRRKKEYANASREELASYNFEDESP